MSQTAIKESRIPQVKPSELVELLTYLIKAMLPVMIVGKPAMAKSALIAMVADMLGFKLLVSHPVVEDPTDSKGLAWIHPGGIEAQWLPFGDMVALMEADYPLIYFVDDLIQAPSAVQASKMRLFLDREICGKRISDKVYLIAASNCREHKAGGSGGIIEPLKSRFATIVELVADLDESCQWYMEHGMPAMLVAFLRFKPELLHAFEPSADMTNSPNLRGWENVGKMMKLGMPRELAYKAYAGAVGMSTAHALSAFEDCMTELPNLDSIIANPEKAKMPVKVEVHHAVSTGLAMKATPENFDPILRYAERMHAEAGKAEFAVYMIKSAVKRDALLQQCSGFIRLMATNHPLGQAIAQACK